MIGMIIYGQNIMKWLTFNKEYPLGLPQGSIRAMLALSMVVFAFIWFFEFKTLPIELTNLITFTLTFYFTKRDGYTNKIGNYKLRYRENNQAEVKETIISGITPGGAIDKLRSTLSNKEYLNLLIDEIIRID